MMLTYLYKKLFKNCAYTALESTQLYIMQKPPSFNLKPFSQKVQFETLDRQDPVISLFITYGFTDTQISNLIKKRPELLSYHPQKLLIPKLEFFNSIDVSPSDLGSILSLDPFVLQRNLENQIIPSYKFLKSVLHTNASVIAAIKRSTWVLKQDLQKYLAPNIVYLRDQEVPDSRISMLLRTQPRALMQIPHQFRVIVEEIKEMGFDPTQSNFIMAITGLTGFSKTTLERKGEAYRKWGWSDEDIRSAFRKAPTCMAASEKKIERVMDFLVNKMGWDASDIAGCPQVILHSLENWTTPRCLVVQFLLSKGLIKKKDFSFRAVTLSGKERFLNKFVNPYCDNFPEVLKLYERKLGSLGLTTKLG